MTKQEYLNSLPFLRKVDLYDKYRRTYKRKS